MNNECAIEFYQKFGFEIVETRDHYYKRIEPAGAHVLEKNLRKNNNQTTATTTTTVSNDSSLSNGTTETNNSNSNHQTKLAKTTA